MGYQRHHAIVVTSWKEEAIVAAHAAAVSGFAGTGASVSAITPPAINGYRSFFVAPDGSKEGWRDSDQGDAARERYLAWLVAAHEVGVYTAWCEVNFGGDDADVMGVRGPDGRLWGPVAPDDPAMALDEQHRGPS